MTRMRLGAWVLVAGLVAVAVSCGGGSDGGRADTGTEEAFDWGSDLDGMPAETADVTADVLKPDGAPDLPPDGTPDVTPDVVDVTPDLDVPPDGTPDLPPDVTPDQGAVVPSTLPLAGELVVTELMI